MRKIRTLAELVDEAADELSNRTKKVKPKWLINMSLVTFWTGVPSLVGFTAEICIQIENATPSLWSICLFEAPKETRSSKDHLLRREHVQISWAAPGVDSRKALQTNHRRLQCPDRGREGRLKPGMFPVANGTSHDFFSITYRPRTWKSTSVRMHNTRESSGTKFNMGMRTCAVV